jgi:predicted transcriptional regulator
MKELDIFWHIMADGLKLLAKGVDSIAEQVESFSKTQGEAAAKKASPKPKPKAAPKKKAPVKAQAKTAIATVYDIIAASAEGVKTVELVKQTGFNTKKVQNIIFKLKKQGKITTRVKGVYIKA